MIQLVVFSGSHALDAISILFSAGVLLILYFTAVMYFDLQPRKLMHHAYQRSKRNGHIWEGLHLPLTFFVLTFGTKASATPPFGRLCTVFSRVLCPPPLPANVAL